MIRKNFTIRLIKPNEHERWFQLLEEYHYLGKPEKVAGERLYYVAENFDGDWLALIGWCAAAMHLHDRDTWIGWSLPIRKLRLKHIANNFRFLIIPGKSYPNLASQLLSTNLKVLSSDWQMTYSHPIYLVETFVDKKKFYGGCYRATNFMCIGETKGFTRKRTKNYYQKNGKPKLIFIREIHKQAKTLLSDPAVIIENHYGRKEEVLVIDVNKLPIDGKGGLIDALKKVPDPRRKQGRRYSQVSGLCLATCAMLSGAKGFKGIHGWAKSLSRSQQIKMRCYNNGKIPSISTIRKMLIKLNAEEFDKIICNWLLKLAAKGDIAGLSVDGKTLRGTKDGKKKQVHLLSALVHSEKVTIAQSKVEDKENEIPCFIPLIKNLPLNKTVVTADAMHCQINHATFLVREKKCDYAFVVKGNQPTLFSETKRILHENSEKSETHSRVTSGHGRIDERTIKLLELTPKDKFYITFPFATHIFKITRHSINKSKGSESNYEKFGITSLEPQRINAESMLEIMLSHWNIEAGHWIRDEVFLEDKSRIRSGSGPQIMAALRNVSIGIMRYAGANNISEAIQDLGWKGPKFAMRAIGIKQ